MMREYEWWEKIFAGRILRDLAMCESVCDDLGEQVKELDEEYDDLLERNLKCLQEKGKLVTENLELQEDSSYLQQRIRKLTSALGDAIVIPDITEFVNPDDFIMVKPRETYLANYKLVTADLEYYALPLETWEVILTAIQGEVEDELGRWVKDIGDCDDYSTIMQAFVAIAFRDAYSKDSRFDRQGAFMIAWSQSHAFNGFMDTDGTVWIYEPQSDVIGDKLEEGTAPYDSRRIWFPHTRVK